MRPGCGDLDYLQRPLNCSYYLAVGLGAAPMGRQFLGGYIVRDGYQVYFRTDACASENEVMRIKGFHHMESLSPIYDPLLILLYPPTCLYCCAPSCLFHLARLLTSRVRSHEPRKHPSVIKFNRPVVNSKAHYNSNNHGT